MPSETASAAAPDQKPKEQKGSEQEVAPQGASTEELTPTETAAATAPQQKTKGKDAAAAPEQNTQGKDTGATAATAAEQNAQGKDTAATAAEQNAKGKDTAVSVAPGLAPLKRPTTVPESASKTRKICQEEQPPVSPHAAPADASSASQPEKKPHYFSKYEVPKAFEKAPGLDKSEYERLLKEAKSDKIDKSEQDGKSDLEMGAEKKRTKKPDPEEGESKFAKSHHKKKSKDKDTEKEEKKRARSSKDTSSKKAKKTK